MSLPLAAERTVVGRLRIRPGAADPMLARLRAATLLSSAELAPGGLSPAAILVVRKLDDPLPGRLGLRGGAMSLPLEWERAVRVRVDAAARSARRPAREAVTDAAEAVLFADYAELLACLARDWMRGALRRWWWRALFPAQDAAAAALRGWLERPQCVPPAMAHLAAGGEAVPFVLRLGRRRAHELLQSVLAAHGLPELREALGALVSEGAAVAPEPPQRRPPNAGAPGAAAPPPWRSGAAIVPEETADGVCEALVGVCRTLQQAPHLAGSREFVAHAKQWAAQQSAARAASVSRLEESPRTPAAARLAAFQAPGRLAPPLERAVEIPAAEKSSGSADVDAATQVELSAAAVPVKELPDVPLARLSAAPGPGQSKPDTAQPGLDEVRIETQFGGVFFLVNLALFLGLYGDFTQPGRRTLSLALWDFVALAGEGLAGPSLRDDAVWALLARLANRREGEEPGGALRPRRGRALHRWLRRLMPRLRMRLRQALGLEEGADPAAVVLRLPARVWATPTRVDVSFALAELPVAVRLSGLDRDPGWLPAAGRSLRFHFD
jgi:hypothetical protein